MDEFRVLCARFPLNELVAAECERLTGSAPDEEGVADRCASLDLVAESAYLSLGARCLAEAAGLDDLIEQVRALSLAADRFRIDLARISFTPQVSEADVVPRLADWIEGDPDLINPLRRFVLVIQERRLWFGEVLAQCNHRYQAHESKPFHTSSSLPARLSRALVNLVRPGARSVLDPFCGTGSILLEAQALGFLIHGVDISMKMVHISRRNPAHFGYQGIVELGDALRCAQTADAIVTDLPYGRGIKQIEQARVVEILAHLATLAPQAIYLSAEPLDDLLAQAGYGQVAVFRVRKRLGMQRCVQVAFRTA